MSDSKIDNRSKDIDSRLKTALIALPILFCFLYFKTLYFILMLLVTKLSHGEFVTIQNKILSLTFKDYYAEINYKTLVSSALTSIIFMLCPIILFFFKNSELFACILPLFILQLHRFNSFIAIYRVLKTNETNFKYQFYTQNEDSNPFTTVKKLENPIKTAIQQSLTLRDKQIAWKNENPRDEFLNKIGMNKAKSASIEKKEEIETKSDKAEKEDRAEKEYKTDESCLLMFNSCLFIIMSDFVFFFLYIYPVCLGISVHNGDHGFVNLLMVVIIAYQCDNGALFVGRKFGRKPFGSPVTPSKTEEGIYGAVLSG
jgi:hypothetical protein